jgi:hypothetical protein
MSNKNCLFPDDALDLKAKNIVIFLNGKLSEEEICDFKETYLYGEEGIACENLCTQIYSSNIKMPRKIFNLLKDICVNYEINESYWQDLEKLIID